MLLFVHEMQLFKKLEQKAHDNSNDGSEHHALNGEGAEGNLRTGEADNHDNRGHDEVGGLAVIHLLLNEDADTGGSNYAEEQHTDAAHDRNRNAVNQLAELAAEGENDGHNSSAADNPGAVDLGDGHNADVFTVGGVRRCAGKAADDVGKTVGEEGAGKARVLNEVTVDDVAGNDQMADVLSEDDEGCRSDNHNRIEVEDWCIKMRQLEPRCVDDGLKVDHAHEGGEDIAADNAEENRNDAQKATEGNGADDADGEREHGDGNVGGVDVITCKAGHVSSHRSKLQTDNGDDGAHSSGREDNINPFRTYVVNDEGEKHEQQAENNEAGLSMIITRGRKN